jgi:NAD(P)-dependent dehydrogenase (short-subunit alcohol dehydrogenase family)
LGEAAQNTVAAITEDGGNAEAIMADISDAEALSAAIGGFVAAHGRLDGVVASAGINGVWAPIDDLKPDEFDRTVSINLRGTYLTMHYTVGHLKAGGGGSIVIVSSINGIRTFSSPGASAYAATKAAQYSLCQQLALELGRFRIRVNAVCPGYTQTGIGRSSTDRNLDEAHYPASYKYGNIPLTGGTPAPSYKVADAVAFLMSDKASHISGTALFVDGAESLIT